MPTVITKTKEQYIADLRATTGYVELYTLIDPDIASNYPSGFSGSDLISAELFKLRQAVRLLELTGEIEVIDNGSSMSLMNYLDREWKWVDKFVSLEIKFMGLAVEENLLIAGKADKLVPSVAVSSNITLTAAHNLSVLKLTGTLTVTVPNGLPDGYIVNFFSEDSNIKTFSVAGTLEALPNGATKMAMKGVATLLNVGSNKWKLVGDVTT